MFETPVEFTHPWALLLLLLLVPVIYWGKRVSASLSPWRRGASIFIRSVIVALLVLALSGIQLKMKQKELSVIFLVDSSLSISQKNKAWLYEYLRRVVKLKGINDEWGVIIFGRNARIEKNISKDGDISTFTSVVDPNYTNIAGAIQMAVALLPDYKVRRIVLISDGNENIGNALKECKVASSKGIKIFTLPYPYRKSKDVYVANLTAPLNVPLYAPLVLKARIESTENTEGILNIFKGKNLIGRERVNIKRGTNVFLIPLKAEESGSFVYTVTVEAKDDSTSQNNSFSTIVQTTSVPKVLILYSKANAKTVASLLRNAGILADIGGTKSFPQAVSDLLGYKAVIFDNFDGLFLNEKEMGIIEKYVKDFGGGFVMVGGDKSFGAGGYYHSPIERILPVSLDLRKRKLFPSAALVLVIDKSGSMGYGEGMIKKIDLARQAAIETVKLLSPNDKIGVLAFDSSAKWIVPLQYAHNKDSIIRDIATLRAGGGTSIYPALFSTYKNLSSSQAKVKHIILLTDGRSEPADFDGLVENLKKSKITLTTIGVGKDADIPFLQRMARVGGGRFYYTDSATYLPRIFTKEALLASQSPIIEGVFRPKAVYPAPFLKGIFTNKVPIIYGFIATVPKKNAKVPVVTPQGDPLLAYWNVCLGRSVAFTTDDGYRWAKVWMDWAKYPQFWVQLIRWVTSSGEEAPFKVTLKVLNGRGKVCVNALDSEGNPINFLPLKARILFPSGKVKLVDMEQVAPGKYEGKFKAFEVGTYIANVTANISEGKFFKYATYTLPYSVEYRDVEENVYFLKKISLLTGGRLLRENQNPFMDLGETSRFPHPLAELLLMIAVVLFPIDVALRRVFLPHSFWKKVASLWKSKSKTEKKEHHTSVAALKRVKTKVREELVYTHKIHIPQEKQIASNEASLKKEEKLSYTSKDTLSHLRKVKRKMRNRG